MSKLTNMISVTAAAEKAGCTTSYIRRLLRDGKLKGQRVSDRCWLVDVTELKQLSKQLTTRSTKLRD
ncbi:hypothetical protein N9Z08_02360 [Pirellulales bacterium]|nr:hypothetical protein [Pirellulales bacterium]